MSRRARASHSVLTAVALLLCLISPGLEGSRRQAPDARTTFVLGSVIDAVSRTPIADAVVTIEFLGSTAAQAAERLSGAVGGGARVPLKVLTNDDGDFAVRNLAPGRYFVSAHAPRYLAGGYL